MTASRAPKPKPKPTADASENSTIGRNPLDALVPAGAVTQVARKRRRPVALVNAPVLVAPHGAGPGVKLTITVPQSLADQVQSILAVRTELSFDQLMSTALNEVLHGLHQARGHHGAS
jgi:hypothetical protein